MTLFETINDELKTAMRAHDDRSKTLLRSIIGDAKNAKIDGKDIDDDKVMQSIIQKAVKEREASALEYDKIVNGVIHADADAVAKAKVNADNERWEADTLRKFLPKEATLEQLTNIVDIVITETGADSMKQMGQVMGKVKKLINDNLNDYTVDMGVVSKIVKSKLS